MIRYNDAEIAIGPEPKIPERKVSFVALKNGKTETFSNINDAKKYSQLVESVVVNKAEIDAAKQAFAEWSEKVFDYWFKELRSEYSDLSEDVFSLCWNHAYDRGHAYGYDEVAGVMVDVADFASDILKTVQK